MDRQISIKSGDLWSDVDGHARVCGIVPVEGIPYAVMLRTRGAGGRKRRPFLFPVRSMLAGDDDWKPVPSPAPDNKDG